MCCDAIAVGPFGSSKLTVTAIGVDCCRITCNLMGLALPPENLIQRLQPIGIATSVLKQQFHKVRDLF